jgi:6-phosphogluconolactonase
MIPTYAPDLKIFEDSSQLSDAVVQLANFRIQQQLEAKGTFHLSLTGGSLGAMVSDGLVAKWNQEPSEYKGLHLWWGDERFVPTISKERNSLAVLQNLVEDSPIHVHQVMSSDSNVDLEVAAKRYNADLIGIEMDLTFLGVGPDGHVASLFPGQWELNEGRKAIAVADSPKPPPERVSFSMTTINSSQAIWLMASGVEKRESVAKIIARDESIPASYVQGKKETLLFVDRAALSGD